MKSERLNWILRGIAQFAMLYLLMTQVFIRPSSCSQETDSNLTSANDKDKCLHEVRFPSLSSILVSSNKQQKDKKVGKHRSSFVFPISWKHFELGNGVMTRVFYPCNPDKEAQQTAQAFIQTHRHGTNEGLHPAIPSGGHE